MYENPSYNVQCPSRFQADIVQFKVISHCSASLDEIHFAFNSLSALQQQMLLLFPPSIIIISAIITFIPPPPPIVSEK